MDNDGDAATTARTVRRLAIAASAVVVVLAGIIGVVVAAQDDDTGATAAATTTTSGPRAITPGGRTPGGTAGSCIEQYDLTTLAHREVAVDATVRSVDGDAVTLTVNQWFKGGAGETVTFNGASALGGITSAGASIDLSPGSRLLVSGDGGFAWSCSFTQPYEAEVARSWQATFDR